MAPGQGNNCSFTLRSPLRFEPLLWDAAYTWWRGHIRDRELGRIDCNYNLVYFEMPADVSPSGPTKSSSGPVLGAFLVGDES